MSEYVVVYERAEDGGWGAYLPDLAGVVALGASRDEVADRIQEALDAYAEGMARLGNACRSQSPLRARSRQPEPARRAAGSGLGERVAHGLEVGRQRSEEYERAYSASKERSSAHSSKLVQLEALEAGRRQLEEAVQVEREALAALGNPKERHDELRAEWRQTQGERSLLLRQQCAVLTEQSESVVRASMRVGAGTGALEERFKAAVTGSGVRGAKVEAFLARVAAANDPLLAWHSSLDELEAYVRGASRTEVPKQPTTELGSFNDADLARIADRITPEQIVELSLLTPDDHPIFEYRTKEGEYIAFKDASAGQQATALLRVLLKHRGGPLIIDQPEDDLDSQVILDIVDRIWTAKGDRQLVFSSHNANLVVNGDAELVVCCDYRAAGDHSGGRIKREGAIDITDVRDEITTVMEGGEKAFRLRKEKYGF